MFELFLFVAFFISMILFIIVVAAALCKAAGHKTDSGLNKLDEETLKQYHEKFEEIRRCRDLVIKQARRNYETACQELKQKILQQQKE